MAKNTKKNAEVVVEETKKKVTKKTAEKKPVEKSVKKTPAKTKTAEKKPVEKAVKISKKSEKADEKKTTKKATKTTAKKAEISARDKLFPMQIDLEGETLVRCDIASWNDFKKKFEEATESGKSMFIADNWPKKYAKDYNALYGVKMPKEGFENNLDVWEIQFFQQTVERCLTVSLYTEAMSTIHDVDLVRAEEGFFVFNNVEFEVYISK